MRIIQVCCKLADRSSFPDLIICIRSRGRWSAFLSGLSAEDCLLTGTKPQRIPAAVNDTSRIYAALLKEVGDRDDKACAVGAAPIGSEAIKSKVTGTNRWKCRCEIRSTGNGSVRPVPGGINRGLMPAGT